MPPNDETNTDAVLSVYGDDEAAPKAAPKAEDVEEQAPAEEKAVEVETPDKEEALAATTEVPSAPAIDVGALANAAKGDMTMTVVLGVVALAGAGTTWKFLTQFSEQRHEQKMKQLDIQERSAGLGNASPQPCQATNAELRAEIEGLKGRLSAVEKKSMSLSADFDGEDLERQVKKLTKTVKAMQEGTH